MGLSIWSMHFIAMLGFNPGTEVRYDVTLTLLSLLLAILATTFAFFSVHERIFRVLAAGVLMGLGICTMHYVGMGAMLSDAELAHDSRFVVLAFAIAIVASTGALMVAREDRTLAERGLAAVVLGFAIVGMHYSAMLGVELMPRAAAPLQGNGGIDPFTLAIAVAAGTGLILFLALLAALSDQRIEALAIREAQRSEQRLRAIMEHLPFGVLVAGRPGGEIRFANAEAERLMRHPVPQATIWETSRHHGALDHADRPLPAEDHVLYEAMHEGRRAGPRVQRYRRGDGTIALFEVTAAPITQEGHHEEALVAFQDVTAKLEAEEKARHAAELRGSEERFRFMAENAPVMLWITDECGAQIYGNKALREFCGVPQVSAQTHWISNVSAEDREALAGQIMNAARTKKDFFAEIHIQRSDGSMRTVQVSARVRLDDRGTFLGLVGVNVDLTVARQAQTELLRMNDILEQRVEVALAEKTQAQEALMHAQRMEALGRLTGGVAHDFNNLLTVVIGALDIMLRHPEKSERGSRLAEAAFAAAKRGERLTAQLLAFARRQPLRIESCDVSDLIRQIEPLMQRAVGDRVSLELRLHTSSAHALIDPAQFEAALLNLVVNAVDATPEGGRICIQTDLHELSAVEIPEVAGGRFLRVRVSDTGEGMSAEVIDRIFEPFFTTKPPGKGTGLGLSQVYGFIRQSGGTIRVQSQPAHGSTFELYLPISAQQAVDQPLSIGRTNPSQLSLKILLTEDDPSVAVITENMLNNLGHEVRRASTAHQALAVLASDPAIQLLITDIAMPGGMNGIELASAAHQLYPGLRILLVSGFAGNALEEPLATDVGSFLSKPYLQDDLDACIRGLFERSENSNDPFSPRAE
jgi:PAS domain S-box-containing protein